MSVAYVILAAGRGTRVGRVGGGLHKSLLPLGEKAMLSRLIDLRPPFPDTHVIICVGDRANQVMDYVRLAYLGYPPTTIQTVPVSNWNEPGAGPGASLLAARELVHPEDHLVFTSCDTLWDLDDDEDEFWQELDSESSWVGVAPVPAGTPPARWCRIRVDDEGCALKILDKDPTPATDALAYVGMSFIHREDLPRFWNGLEKSDLTAGERQVSGGLQAVLLSSPTRGRQLRVRRVKWTDVGDEDSYRHAVAVHSGYDWIKSGQATFVLPESGRVVKYHEDPTVVARRAARAHILGPDVVPRHVDHAPNMMSYDYVPGISGYDAVERGGQIVVHAILDWFARSIWSTRRHDLSPNVVRGAAMSFYRDKTFERVSMLSTHLRSVALDVVTRVDWDYIVQNVTPGTWHGDLNFGNIIVEDLPIARTRSGDAKIIGIDWREDFAGITTWGDLRYDLAKLLAGCVIHWDRARRGDFRPWDDGVRYAEVIRIFTRSQTAWISDARVIEIIAALTLINSAPLHAPPLDEVLVARAVNWLEDVL